MMLKADKVFLATLTKKEKLLPFGAAFSLIQPN
jgi:hypothetical protein